MASSVVITALPAQEGDALLVECRTPATFFTMLIDGGRAAAEPDIRTALKSVGRLDLLVVSHIDLDHIEGAVRLLQNDPPVRVGEIWFNGLTHLTGGTVPPSFRDLAPSDGVELTAEIGRLKIPWNLAFGHGPVCVPHEGVVIRKDFGPVALHVLSPDSARLRALAQGSRAWLEDVQAPARRSRFRSLGETAEPDVEALAAAPDRNDTASPNGTSIAFLMEFKDWRFLFTADAHPRIVAAGLRGLGATEADPLPIDLMKVSHHGSRENTTAELLKLVKCTRFLVSGNGAHATRPHDETLAKIIMANHEHKVIGFNYEHAAAARWASASLQDKHGFQVRIQDTGNPVVFSRDDG